MVVAELLSSEYPIAATLCDKQTAAVAERLNGDETVAPGIGLMTVTPAVVEGTTVIFRFTTPFTL